MKKYFLIISLMPAFAFSKSFRELAISWVGLVNAIVQILFSLALVVFFWSMATVIFKTNDSSKATEARNRITWSVLGMFVLFSIWGLLKFLESSIF